MTHDLGGVAIHIWLAKCSARKRSGRPVKSAIALGRSVELLVAKIVLAGAALPSFA